MKRTVMTIATLLLVQIMLAAPGWCGWWIFTLPSEDEMTLSLYLNGTPLSELGQHVTLYSETLRNGEVTLKGKVTAGKNNKMARVEVSLDGKGTWQSLPLETGGTVSYSFRLAPGKKYEMYVQGTDSAGHTNAVDATFHEITLSTQNITELINRTLRELMRAYEDRNAAAFMANVSGEFVGDAANLDRALRKDFSFFDNVMLSYTINNLTASRNRVYVSLSYNRSLISSRSGVSFRDNGLTDIAFTNDSGRFKIYSMKNPLIFGLSDAANLATGNSANNPSALVLTVDNLGKVTVKTYRDLISGTGPSSGASPAPPGFQFVK